jgi:hypothetical protein
VGLLVGGTVAFPAAGLIATVGAAGALAMRRIGAARREDDTADADVIVFADVLALGLGSGLGLSGSLREAARWVSPPVAGEVRDVLRTMRGGGSATALAAAGGRIGPLCRLLAAATLSGAPMSGVVEAFAAERRRAAHAARVTAARRLPVRLLVPLALLILPGFVVLAVGPALIDALARLDPMP